jgi:hypothetical protein
MNEIVIVKAWFYEKGAEFTMPLKQETPDALWWFDAPDATTLADVIEPSGKLGEGVMTCDAIRFTFDYCPNPDATHFDVSMLHDECVYGEMLRQTLGEDVPQFAEMAKRRLKAIQESGWPTWVYDINMYMLYDVEGDEHRDEDGGLDHIVVIPTLVGEIDFSKLAKIVVAEKKPTS